MIPIWFLCLMILYLQEIKPCVLINYPESFIFVSFWIAYAYANNVSFVLPKLKINYLILTRLIQRGQFWVNHYIHLLELFFVLNWFILDHCILFSSFNSRFTKIWIRSMLKAKYVKRKKCLKRKKTYLNGFE